MNDADGSLSDVDAVLMPQTVVSMTYIEKISLAFAAGRLPQCKEGAAILY